jgi:hypothetical protein
MVRLKTKCMLTDSALKVVIFYPIYRCQRTSNGTLPAVSAGSLDPAQLKIVSDGSSAYQRAEFKI